MFRLITKPSRITRVLGIAAAAIATLCSVNVLAAIPGITGMDGSDATFYLTAAENYISQPDGASIYSWGYGCDQTHSPTFFPATTYYTAGRTISRPVTCTDMQVPGPTLIVTEGATVTITLTNKLPVAAGNTSLVVPGFTVTPVAGTGVAGLITQEAEHGGSVTYTFLANKPGTYSYYSGTQPEIQNAMGMYGAIIVKPNPTTAATLCPGSDFHPTPVSTDPTVTVPKEPNLSISTAAYDNASTCYDIEYLFQLGEIDTNLNNAVRDAVAACPTGPCPTLSVPTEPYWPQYYVVNGRSLPDDADIPYAPGMPHQPYNGNPHMHPGQKMLIRLIGVGRYQHPLHIHANHARVLAYDGNLITSQSADPADPEHAKLAGPLFYTLTSVSGQTMDSIFTWTGKDLNWDVYGRENPHTCNGIPLSSNPNDPGQQSAGYDPITHEYCPDHGKPIPVTPPDPAIVANGLWYGGTPYLGLQAVNPTPLPPGANIQNPDAAYGYPWHSHDEREITTNNVFPGGMMMILLIDPPTAYLDETL